jgi:hypothetical protein
LTVIKVLEVVGESSRDWHQAVSNAVVEASKMHPNIKGVEVINWTAGIESGKMTQFKANCKIAYLE